jgi:hypothetical protein
MFQGGMLAFYVGFVVLGVWAALSPAPRGQAGAEIMGGVIAAVGLACALLLRVPGSV